MTIARLHKLTRAQIDVYRALKAGGDIWHVAGDFTRSAWLRSAKGTTRRVNIRTVRALQENNLVRAFVRPDQPNAIHYRTKEEDGGPRRNDAQAD